MIRLIHRTDGAARAAMLAKMKSRSVAFDQELLQAVSAIIDDVRQRGDEALRDYTRRFDGIDLGREQLRLDQADLRRSAAHVDFRVVEALREAIRNVRAFHERQIEQSWEYSPAPGVVLGQQLIPLESVGVYVPGGTAAYPSSVVMNVVPAQIAGVDRIVVVTPPRTITENPAVAAALVELNVTEVYATGGAQAVAALAFGTESIPRVDKITGPGNKYVAAAKKLVFGVTGIDSIAGPTEVVIVADEIAEPRLVAADLLAQAEHGADASAILITTSEKLAREVAAEVARQLEQQRRREIIRESLSAYGFILILDDWPQACMLVNQLAPEHLHVIVADEQSITARIKHAGAIFFGSYTPEVVGDYWAGPNHVLPTGGAARFSSALGVYDFVKRTSVIRYSEDQLQRVIAKIATLAESEGLFAHASAAKIRLSHD
jgi:histidinol dehydrogenase